MIQLLQAGRSYTTQRTRKLRYGMYFSISLNNQNYNNLTAMIDMCQCIISFQRNLGLHTPCTQEEKPYPDWTNHDKHFTASGDDFMLILFDKQLLEKNVQYQSCQNNVGLARQDQYPCY